MMRPGKLILSTSPVIIGEDEVQQFEWILLHRLPDDYRAFLLETNGGRVEGSWGFDLPANNGSSLDQFYRLKDKSRSTTTLAYMRQLYAERMPKGVLAIACDPGGGKLCLGYMQQPGRVWFWDPGMDYDDTVPGSFENFHEVAESFTHFLTILTSSD